MSDDGARRPVKRGLSALMADIGVTATDMADRPRTPERTLPIEQLAANPDQPRRTFDEAALSDLSASIAQKGILQPLIVRPRGEGAYQIVAGERRWRAAQQAGLHEVPVIVRDLDDAEVLEIGIIENIQRADLNAIEEAAGFRQLMDSFGHTQEQLSTILGKSRSHVANLMRLLKLPEAVQSHVREGRLSAGHARALVTTDNAESLAQDVIQKGLSVRETERLARGPSEIRPVALRRRPAPDADTAALEGDLSASVGLGVSIEHRGADGGGRVTIRYRTLEDLDRICGLLSSGRG